MDILMSRILNYSLTIHQLINNKTGYISMPSNINTIPITIAKCNTGGYISPTTNKNKHTLANIFLLIIITFFIGLCFYFKIRKFSDFINIKKVKYA
jgi:hypothetical protein